MKNPIRHVYSWVLSLAGSPWSTACLFGLAFAESSFFPIPPDVLLVALVLGAPSKAWLLAANCTLASVLGGLAGYAIGHWLWMEDGHYTALAEWFFAQSWLHHIDQVKFTEVAGYYERYNFWIVFVAAFTPIPYKAITISAGAFDIAFIPFFIASIVGRGARFFLVAWMLKTWGPPMKDFIDRWFNLLSVGFAFVLILGFWALKVLT
ncbi:MAG: YqaA family protein [Planctomycetota bacterium]